MRGFKITFHTQLADDLVFVITGTLCAISDGLNLRRDLCSLCPEKKQQHRFPPPKRNRYAGAAVPVPLAQRDRIPARRAGYQMVEKQKGAIYLSRGSHTMLWPT